MVRAALCLVMIAVLAGCSDGAPPQQAQCQKPFSNPGPAGDAGCADPDSGLNVHFGGTVTMGMGAPIR